MSALKKLSSFIVRYQFTLHKRAEPILKKQYCQCSCSKSRPVLRSRGWSTISTPIRHFRVQSSKTKPAENGSKTSLLIRPFGFTVLVCTASFSGAIVWQYESLRTLYRKQYMQEYVENNGINYGKAGDFRHHINAMWNRLTPGTKLVAEIISINVAVFLLWKVKPLTSFMMKYFSSSPFTGAKCSSMLLSTFSQHSIIHLACNMYVLWSFAGPVTLLFGKEQFLAFFLSAGVISSLTSYMNKVARVRMTPSVGASGAILAVLGAVCAHFPQSELSIAFVDKIIPHSFSADTGMKAIIMLDITGVILGWAVFDHAAHLGGMLFGIWYVKYGGDLVWKQFRESLMKYWHGLRGKP